MAALNLTTAPIDEREFTRTIRTVGTIVLDETRTAHVHVKVRGFIDRIFVNYVGRQVREGEPLCAIFSQEIYSAELEFLSILEGASTRPAPDPLLAAARRRLSLWDVPQSEIERLEKTRQVNRTFPLLAPRPPAPKQRRDPTGCKAPPRARRTCPGALPWPPRCRRVVRGAETSG